MAKYIMTPQKKLELDAINQASQSKVIICDHGYGPCIEDDFLNLNGFDAQIEWFNAANLELIDEGGGVSI